MSIIGEILEQAAQAERKYGPFTSTHEALGVLVEECDELRAAIHANKLGSVYLEAIQVAAVAMRLAAQCEDVTGTAFAKRSGVIE